MSANLLSRKFLLILTLLVACFTSNAQLVTAFTATPLSGCAPLVVQFNNQSTGAVSFQWDLGNSTTSVLQNPSTTYFNAGTYTVRLITTNAAGLKDTLIKTAYITVNARPVVNFTGSPLSGCFPLPVQFTNSSTAGSGTITSYFWDFGDGASSTSATPSHIYTASGNNNVSLQVTNSSGCANSNTKPSYVNVAPGVTALFSNNSPSGCGTPQTITFINQSSGAGALTYAWNFGDGGTSNLQNPQHTYTTSGTFSVQLTVTNSSGCTRTYTNPNPIVIGSVNANFTSSSPACVGNAISFTNTSSPTPVSVTWNFGDGTTSTDINPIKIYNSPSIYNVTMVANFGGCSATSVQQVSVFPKPTSSFTANPIASCSAPFTVTFTNSSTGGNSTQWFFGDGNTSTALNPTHTYNAIGNYGVTLITTNANGCSDTLRSLDSIKVFPPNAIINGLPRQGCAPLTHQFSATVNTVDPVATYQWDFGDGTTSTLPNPTHTFPLGSYNIQLIIITNTGCRDTVIVPNGITASPKPTANFNANPREVCAFNPVNFQDLSTGLTPGTTWLWYFGDGGSSTLQNPIYSYNDTGYFDVQLIVSNNGCSDTITFEDFIHVLPPIANFNVGHSCVNKFTKTFTDASIGADTHAWNFGDGNTSNQVSPTHTYAAVGTYTVTLTVTNNVTGCSHVRSGVVIVSNETANFTADATQLCKNASTTFNASSINNPSGIVSYLWNFGDNTTSSGNNISHTYTTAGAYTVKLYVTDANGCIDSLIRPNYINVFGPTANFNPSVPGSCLQQNITFTDLSTTDGTHSLVEWTWNYGDNSPIQVLASGPFTHAYNSSGQYSVILKVKDSYGCIDSITKTNVLTISTPFADFVSDPVETCPGQPVIFTNSATGPSLTYAWTFGDGGTSTDPNPIHVYNNDGTYDVHLTVTDQYGCVDDTLKMQYIVVNTPLANFGVSDSLGTCSQLNVQFSDSSLNAQTRVWDFGDGTSSGATNPQHFYSAPGVYVVKLTITSIGSCISEKTRTIRVRGPQGTFTYAPVIGCNPLTVTFTAQTQDRVSFIWDFSDGSTQTTTDSVVSHTYTTLGNFVPRMILVGQTSGCTVPILGLDTIKVNGADARFITDTLLRCNNGNVTFTSTSTSTEPITGYLWNFGDGNTSTDPNPTHYYANMGAYTPTLIVTTASTCRDTSSVPVSVRVVKTPEVNMVQPLSGCEPFNTSFNANLVNADTSAIQWQWVLSNGNTLNTQNLTNQLFTTVGTNTANLIVTNSSGCKDTADGSFQVFPKPVISAGSDLVICKGTGQTLNATGGNSYSWSPSVGLSCSNCPSPLANPDSVKNYIVTGTSAQGCSNKDTINVSVRYPFDITQGPNLDLCIGQSGRLSTSGAFRYEWSPSTGLNTNTGNTVNANPSTTTLYSVVGFDDKNCFTDTAKYLVKVFPIPTINAGDDKTINVGNSLTLTPTFSSDVNSIVWTPSTWIVGTNYPSITVKPNLNQEYKVTARNAGGCTNSDIVNVFVLCDGSNFYIPNTFSPNGDGMNDKFYPRGTGLFTIKQLRIFDRWGNEVFARYNFKANEETSGWDGTYKDQKVGSEVYVYLIELLCDNNTSLIYKGNIALVK
jgi:gliding motility-associated-like protein